MTLKEALAQYLSEEELGHLVRSYDIVGDIAIIIIPDELVKKEHLIGKAILDLNKNVKVVLKRDGIYQGEFRQIPLKVIAGENRKETICKENGVRLALDPEQVYYSVRSSGERKRIASLVAPGENVLVMFSGIGPFPLVISKLSQAETIVGVEKNPVAHAFGVKNVRLNKKLKNVQLISGDVGTVLPELKTMFDRIVMPLPKSAHLFVANAVEHLSRNGWLHYYELLKKEDVSQAINKVEEIITKLGRTVASHNAVVCGHCGPTLYRICIDFNIP